MKNKLYLYLFIALTIIYVGLTFGLPTDPSALHKYHTTQGELRLLDITIVLPLILVWFSALYGFLRFQTYATLINESREGKPLNYLANGLMILAISLPINGIVSACSTYLSFKYIHIAPTAAILRNYISLSFSLVALLTIAKGAEGLVKTLRHKSAIFHPTYITLAVMAFSSVFTWLIIARPAGDPTNETTYYLPNWLIIFTILIPYLLVWYRGVVASYHLYVYRDKVKGLVYKRAFEDLAKGIGTIVGLSIFLQLLTTLTGRIQRLHLTPILVLVYLLVGMYAIGFGLVARGAKNLKRIEEV